MKNKCRVKMKLNKYNFLYQIFNVIRVLHQNLPISAVAQNFPPGTKLIWATWSGAKLIDS